MLCCCRKGGCCDTERDSMDGFGGPPLPTFFDLGAPPPPQPPQPPPPPPQGTVQTSSVPNVHFPTALPPQPLLVQDKMVAAQLQQHHVQYGHGGGGGGGGRMTALSDMECPSPGPAFSTPATTPAPMSHHPSSSHPYQQHHAHQSRGHSGADYPVPHKQPAPLPPGPGQFGRSSSRGIGGQPIEGETGLGGWPVGFESTISATIGNNTGLCTFLLTGLSVIIILVTSPLSLFFCIKVVQEYERAVIFRLGRLLRGGARGPGIFFVIPCIDTYSKVDLRTVSFDVPPQEILSKDSVTVAVDAVVYYRISNATVAISNVEDYGRSTRLLAATTLRNVLGTKNLSEILSERETISHIMQSALDEATDPWGVKVERVEIKDVRLPVQLQRAMAAEAEAAREARAKVIAAEGEQRASKALREASEVISQSPAALQLRYLQTLNSIAAEKNSTIIFPVPIEMFSQYAKQRRPRDRKSEPEVDNLTGPEAMPHD